MPNIGLYQVRQNSRLKRSMLARAFCYVMILCSLAVLIAWSPLAKPQAAQSQVPMLMQLEAPQYRIDSAVLMLPDAQIHKSSMNLHAAMPELSQVTIDALEVRPPKPVTYNHRPLRAVKTIRMLVFFRITVVISECRNASQRYQAR